MKTSAPERDAGTLWRIISPNIIGSISGQRQRVGASRGRRIFGAALEVDVTPPTASIILELSSDRRYSGWVRGVILMHLRGGKCFRVFMHFFFFKKDTARRGANLPERVRNFTPAREISALFNCTWTPRVLFSLLCVSAPLFFFVWPYYCNKIFCALAILLELSDC